MNTWIELNAQHLMNNLELLGKRAGKATLMPVLKANAYGHGISQVFEIFANKGMPEWLGVNDLGEAEVLRKLGFGGRILVMGPLRETDIKIAKALTCDFFMSTPEIFSSWKAEGFFSGAHLKIDTGMGRQGFAPKDFEKFYERELRPGPGAERLAGVCTHFANVEDVLEQDFADQQLKVFEAALLKLRSSGFSGMVHAASSASGLILPSSRLDLVRAGISTYGFWPSARTRLSYTRDPDKKDDLLPVLSWKTRVMQLKTMEPGSFIGYGCSYRTEREEIIAVLPVGYFEGYPRLASKAQSYVLVDGHRCPVRGRVCMNMMMIEVTHVPSVRVGSEAVLIGASDKETLPAEQLAEWAETIHYEIVTRIHDKIPRFIV